MEIQKIFSDFQGEERLYSVLLSEDEVRLFASAQALANKVAKNNIIKKMGGRAALKNSINAGYSSPVGNIHSKINFKTMNSGPNSSRASLGVGGKVSKAKRKKFLGEDYYHGNSTGENLLSLYNKN